MRRVPVTITRKWFLIPPWAAAQVPFKRTIWVKRSHNLTVTELAHELAHVVQAEQHPWPTAYFTQWFMTGMDYSTMPFEVEARRFQSEPFFVAWAEELLRKAMGPS